MPTRAAFDPDSHFDACSRQAPACHSRGLRLADLASHQCRFPLRGDGADMRFCAVEIAPAEWLPGMSLGSYCTFHRGVARGGDTP